MGTKKTGMKNNPLFKKTDNQPKGNKQTSKQVNITTGNQDYTPTSTQDYETTSKHVYTAPPEQRIVVTQERTSSHTQAADHISPPGEYVPQGYVPGQNHTEMSGSRDRRRPELYRRQTYHLRPDQIEQIRVEAFHTRRKISQVVRDIIDQYYQHKREY